mgnify:CR=1 FL=1
MAVCVIPALPSALYALVLEILGPEPPTPHWLEVWHQGPRDGKSHRSAETAERRAWKKAVKAALRAWERGGLAAAKEELRKRAGL